MVAIISAVNKRFVFIVVVILVYTKNYFSALSDAMTESWLEGLSGIANFSIFVYSSEKSASRQMVIVFPLTGCVKLSSAA